LPEARQPDAEQTSVRRWLVGLHPGFGVIDSSWAFTYW
jgi:hypothetical protein